MRFCSVKNHWDNRTLVTRSLHVNYVHYAFRSTRYRLILAWIVNREEEREREREKERAANVPRHRASKSPLILTCARARPTDRPTVRYSWLIKSGRALRGRRRDRPQDTGKHIHVARTANRIWWATLGRWGRGGCRMFNRTGRVQCPERLSALDIPSVSTYVFAQSSNRVHIGHGMVVAWRS